ncbi:MAG: hypothetical protein KKE73_10890 [Proteobacteria bacterium]|nr:hypothetical protein [Pseudomonadota bacterium]
MDERERIIRQHLKDDLGHYARKCLKIRTKSGRILPFVFNRAQRHLHARLEEQRKVRGLVRAYVLKGRQQGCSTYVGSRFFHQTTHRKGCKTMILAHDTDATDNLFAIVNRFYDHCPSAVRPSTRYSSKKELVFGALDSGYALQTAGSKAGGRSDTIQLFHGSEVAFWKHAADIASGAMQTILDAEGTEVILESTANGMGNFFHVGWQEAEAGISDYEAIFIPWFWQPEYRLTVPEDFHLDPEEQELMYLFDLTIEQIVWRRKKIIDIKDPFLFKQEYPMTAEEAFQVTGQVSFITASIVLRARKADVQPSGPVVCGVDPAWSEEGADRTAFIFRQGRKAFGLKTYSGKNTMEVAGLCRRVLEADAPRVDRMFIDVGGIGAGIVDRLTEMGFGDRFTAVNFGSSALREERYKNKRAEMWGEMKDWLNDETLPHDIPDDNALHADLVGPQFTYDSSNRLVLESKKEMRARGVRSPDAGDALALTFAAPVRVGTGQTARPVRTFMPKGRR